MGWLNNGDHAYDFGLLDLLPNQQGVSISATVGGGLVITFNPGNGNLNAGQTWTLFGDNLGGSVYGKKPGTALVQCTGQASPSPSYPGQVYVSTPACVQRMFGGNSGGPWINSSNGVTHGIGAVNSTQEVSGTYLGGSAQAAFNLM